MIIRSIDENGDWVFGKGKSSYKRSDKAIEQNIKTRYLEWVGDCFFNKEAGIDWNGRLDFSSRDLLELDIRKIILQSEGVTELASLSVELVNRIFKATYTIKTINSTILTNEL